MLTRVTHYIQKYNLLPPGSKVLVGVSGGADSTALLHILCTIREKLNIELTAAHFNHGIRLAADGDERFVLDLCASLGVPCRTGRADVPALAMASGVSLEVAARNARHAFFKEVLSQGYDRLALAHHRDDQAETVLLRLLRGSGTKGLGAMAAAEPNGIVRPLLSVGRDDILAFCRENGIQWREDETNSDLAIPRNRVRHEIMPAIQKLNPAAAQTLCRAAELLREDEEYLDGEAEKALAGLTARADGGVSVPARDIAGLHPAVKSRALRKMISRAGLIRDVERVNIDDAAALLAGGMSGRRMDLGEGFTALREGATFSVAPRVPEVAQIQAADLAVPGATHCAGGTFISEVIDGVPEECRRHANTVQYFDYDHFPQDAMARSRQPGDRFHPLGAPGGRKLKEYLIDRKVPRWSRDGIPMLASGNDVLWVVGYGIADDVKITGETRRVLKCTYINGEETR